MAKAAIADIRKAILKDVPKDGSAIGNLRLRERIAERLAATVAEDDYVEARDALIAIGKLAKGQGRGGSVRRILDDVPTLTLASQEVPASANASKPTQTRMSLADARRAKAEVNAKNTADDAEVIAYRHDQTRKNNPDVGVVTPDNDPDQPKTRWAFDPHIDPALQFDVTRAQVEALIDDALASGDDATMRAALEQLKRQAAPYLNWTGKAERTSFEVDTVSLHVHERIDPASILAVVRKRLRASAPSPATAGEGWGEGALGTADMFRAWFEEPLPLREAVDFYKHERGWANRLVAGDSLLVMNSLLQKESMAGQVQMIYIDPPYGIKYGSNFQPFVNKRDVKDRKDEDLTQEPEMIKAFRDTWELGIHSYLTYLRDRLLLAKELLHESGSVFVQISDENLHHVREVMDEVFGPANFVCLIQFAKTSGLEASDRLATNSDFLVWYAKDFQRIKYHQIFVEKEAASTRGYEAASSRDRPFALSDLTKPGPGSKYEVTFQGRVFEPGNRWWGTTPEGMARVACSGRLVSTGNLVRFKRWLDDFPLAAINATWQDIGGSVQSRQDPKVYVVQTGNSVIERCLLMTTAPGDLVLDPTCGSGTTAFVAEKWGRRWITCDTSRVAVTLAKQRLMTASYDYYELKYPHEGLRGGFIYKTVPHVTLKSIANNPDIDDIYARMHPAIAQALTQLNAALLLPSPSGRGVGGEGAPKPIRFTIREGGRKGQVLSFGVGEGSHKSGALTPTPLPDGEGLQIAPEGGVQIAPEGEELQIVPEGEGLLEWEVPFDFPVDWPDTARAAFDAFHAARQAMQRKMDDSIAAHADQETLYDQPAVAKNKLRITGPFTVEAVPFPTVLALDETQQSQEADASIARSGESMRQHSWRDELLKTGIRGKGGQMLKFAELETLPDMPHLHCSGHLDSGERVVVSFGPEHAALEQRQVELAMREAGDLFPRPKMIVFCAFTFDPEAAKDIDATRGITALKAQMNTDLLTEDLKKHRSNNQSFWLMGQPDVEVRPVDAKGKPRTLIPGPSAGGRGEYFVVEVNGFDYFDTTSGELKSGGKKNIAAWSLDTDYDERSLFPRQVFFPMAGAKDGWNKLKKDIKAELDESKLDKLHGTISLPFEAGDNRKVAVKIVDDRGIESLKVIALP